MKDIEKLQLKIEAKRLELEAALSTGNPDDYYKISLEMDSMIEQYLDISKQEQNMN